MKNKCVPLLIVLLHLLSSYQEVEFPEPISTSKSIPKAAGQQWELIFEDDFDGTTYDPKKWSWHRPQERRAPWNKYVVANDPSLLEIRDGNLYIRARWNEAEDRPETGAIESKDKFSFMYGKIEIRAKFTRSGQGGWPALWLMPQNQIFKGWPNCGEIDIMERLNDEDKVWQVIHQSITPGVELKPSPFITPPIDKSVYNTYGVIRSKHKIEFQLNGVTTMVYEKGGDNAKMWPFETDFYIIMNYACADRGNSGTSFWPGPVVDTNELPYEMAVDWVKVYK